MSEVDLFEIIRTTRAVRRLEPDPVPDELGVRILESAVCAPSGGNGQPCSFLVVKDPETKRRVQHCYALAYEQHVKPRYDRIGPAPGMDDAGHRRQVSSVAHLTEHFHEAPVWIVACLDTRERPPNAAAGASIDPAVQNMLLTARALGLDATLTTRHTMHGAEVDEIFGLPPNDHSLAIVPIGHPIGAFGPERRAPLGTVVHGDRWGAPPAFEGLGGAGGE